MLAELDITVLADVNATLNSIAFLLIVAGLIAIRARREDLHKLLMLTATGVSALFLISYLTYHLSAEPVRFTREGPIRVVYYTVLITHVFLAAVQTPLILITIWLGLKDRRDKHRRWARFTAPIWLYVSVTGVVVYWMLYWM